MSPFPPDNRHAERVGPYVAPCRILAGDARPAGYVTDLSEAGACVSCDLMDLSPGTALVIEIRFGKGAKSRLPGRVQWSKPAEGPSGASVFGVTFEGLKGADEKVLQAALGEFRRRAALLA